MPAPPQMTLFGDVFDDRRINIYHDESEIKKRGYLLIGLVYVPQHKLDHVYKSLQRVRDKYEYYGEIHFRKLNGKPNHPKSLKEKVAIEWMDTYVDTLYTHINFSALIVDQKSPSFMRERFKQNFHIYNRFTALAIKAGIKKFYSTYPEVKLKIYSDKKDRKTSPTGELLDNFDKYVPFRVWMDSILEKLYKQRAVPRIHFHSSPLVLIDSSERSPDGELIQLTDMLLGSLKQVIEPSKKPTKLELGRKMFSVLYADRDLTPNWKYVKTSVQVWRFPDEDGRPTNKFPVGILRHFSRSLSRER